MMTSGDDGWRVHFEIRRRSSTSAVVLRVQAWDLSPATLHWTRHVNNGSWMTGSSVSATMSMIPVLILILIIKFL